MKNLKDEIEGILQPMFQYEVQICTKCQHSFGEHYWGAELDSCHHEGCKCVADHGGYRTEVRNDSVPESYVAELTSLIEQEREKAVREFVGTIRLNGYSIENRFESPPENKMSVFVMLELMITAMYNYFGKHLAKESEGKS